MTKAYILTEDEYEELLKKKTECDVTLRETNANLKKKIDKLEQSLATQSPKSTNFQGPFTISGNSLTITSWYDFIAIANGLSTQYSCTNWKKFDEVLLYYIMTIASWYNVESQFNSTVEIKRYRLQNLRKYQNTTSCKVNHNITFKVESIGDTNA